MPILVNGSPAISGRPVTFRPCLATGLAFSFRYSENLCQRFESMC